MLYGLIEIPNGIGVRNLVPNFCPGICKQDNQQIILRDHKVRDLKMTLGVTCEEAEGPMAT